MDPHGRLSSHTKLSSSKVARSKKPVFLLAISQCGKHTHNTLFPFSHRDRHQCPSVDHTHLPPICYHDELLSRLKKTHSDPGNNQIQHLNHPPGKLKANHLTNLCLGCKGKIKLAI
ncbi:LOW QUALITY PROTEIN: hypothetical protein NC652_002989 [Populus alba x Populus x berolinensis]|nr:LOW QUALITY PROTEIN: hypothetical protein NC652_002989 [Populus alba x Populus x berolinensis]